MDCWPPFPESTAGTALFPSNSADLDIDALLDFAAQSVQPRALVPIGNDAGLPAHPVKFMIPTGYSAYALPHSTLRSF